MNSIIQQIKTTDRYILFIYFYCFIMPWNFFNGQFGTLTILLFIAWIGIFRKNTITETSKIFFFAPLLILFTYIAYTYITPFWSDSISDGLDYINQYTKYYFLFIPALFTTLNIDQAKNSIKLMILSFCLYSIFSLLIFFGFFTIEDSTAANPKGILAYSVATQYMAMGTLGGFFIAIFSKNKTIKMTFFMLSGLSFLALFANNSRTAQLAFLLSVVTIIFIYYKKSILKPKIFLFAGTSLIIILSLSFIILEKTEKLERYKKATQSAQKAFFENYYAGSTGARIFFNKEGIKIFAKNPIFGTGPIDNWEQHKETQKASPNFKHHIVSSFHSQHLDILTAFGLLGYALLVSSIIYLLYKTREEKEYFYIGLSFYVPIFYISFANATFYKKPINYILITVFVLLSVIAYRKVLENKNVD